MSDLNQQKQTYRKKYLEFIESSNDGTFEEDINYFNENILIKYQKEKSKFVFKINQAINELKQIVFPQQAKIIQRPRRGNVKQNYGKYNTYIYNIIDTFNQIDFEKIKTVLTEFNKKYKTIENDIL